MSKIQILLLDGHRMLAETQVLIESEHQQNVTWEITVLDDGRLNIKRQGSFCFDIRPSTPSSVTLVPRTKP